MKASEWRELIISAVQQSVAGDDSTLQLLSEALEETDTAKQELRSRGYGVTGQSLLATVQMIEARTA